MNIPNLEFDILKIAKFYVMCFATMISLKINNVIIEKVNETQSL